MTNEHSSKPKKTNAVSKEADQEESWWLEAIKTVGLSLLLAFGIRTFVAEARYIPSGSMEPTLLINDRLIVDKVSYHLHQPRRGDIVVFNPTTTLREQGFKDAFIKRVVGLPGDSVFVKQGQVFINGTPLDEQYTASPRSTSVETCNYNGYENPYLGKTQVIPDEHYLVLGDNRQNSFDGRCWGLVARTDLVGRAVFRFWPVPRLGLISNAESHAEPNAEPNVETSAEPNVEL